MTGGFSSPQIQEKQDEAGDGEGPSSSGFGLIPAAEIGDSPQPEGQNQ